jgi:glycosyltransferase involved in cell wall biosynthesis
MKTLSILICTLPDRSQKLHRLNSILLPQVRQHIDNVFIYYNDAGPRMPTGTKRNLLISCSSSDYFVFVDDDDMISGDYVSKITAAMETGRPDVITFNGFMTTNGGNRENFTIRLNSEYKTVLGHHYRWPNHIVPVRRDAVSGIHFPDIWMQEDYLWSKKVKDSMVLKSEVHIDADLYQYDYYTKPKKRRW